MGRPPPRGTGRSESVASRAHRRRRHERPRHRRDTTPSGRGEAVIFGAHVIVYSRDASADRAFFRDVLGYPFVDAGHDWLIFTLPPAEVAVHPADDGGGHELYLMCDDLGAEVASLAEKG